MSDYAIVIIKCYGVIEAEERRCNDLRLCKSNNHFSQSNLIVNRMSAVYVYHGNQMGVKPVTNDFHGDVFFI